MQKEVDVNMTPLILKRDRGMVAGFILSILAICIGIWICIKPIYFHDMTWQMERDLECSSQKKTSSRFVIVHFTDLHFGESESKDLKSKGVMQRVLHEEGQGAIDLVVFGGDQVSGWSVNSRWLALSKWLESISTVYGMKIHFATIFGNHDDQPSIGDDTPRKNQKKPLNCVV